MIWEGPVKGDLVLRYDLPMATGNAVEIYTKINNIFDQLYYEDGYLGPGAWVITGLRFNY